MEFLGLELEWVIFRDLFVEGLNMGQTSNPS